jgi:hypothetical protein
MPFKTLTGESLALEITWNGVDSCPDFLAIEGLSLGQAAHLSSCNCDFHRKLRSEEEWESEDHCTSTDLPSVQTP